MYERAQRKIPSEETTHWHTYHIGMYKAWQAHGILPGRADLGYSGQNPILLEMFIRLGRIDAKLDDAR